MIIYLTLFVHHCSDVDDAVTVPAPPGIYTLSLHDALPIWVQFRTSSDFDLWLRLDEQFKLANLPDVLVDYRMHGANLTAKGDRKSTRLNSSHVSISYAVFCLKKKRITIQSAYLM